MGDGIVAGAWNRMVSFIWEKGSSHTMATGDGSVSTTVAHMATQPALNEGQALPQNLLSSFFTEIESDGLEYAANKEKYLYMDVPTDTFFALVDKQVELKANNEISMASFFALIERQYEEDVQRGPERLFFETFEQEYAVSLFPCSSESKNGEAHEQISQTSSFTSVEDQAITDTKKKDGDCSENQEIFPSSLLVGLTTVTLEASSAHQIMSHREMNKIAKKNKHAILPFAEIGELRNSFNHHKNLENVDKSSFIQDKYREDLLAFTILNSKEIKGNSKEEQKKLVTSFFVDSDSLGNTHEQTSIRGFQRSTVGQKDEISGANQVTSLTVMEEQEPLPTPSFVEPGLWPENYGSPSVYGHMDNYGELSQEDLSTVEEVGTANLGEDNPTETQEESFLLDSYAAHPSTYRK